jgi:hypothetical protein
MLTSRQNLLPLMRVWASQSPLSAVRLITRAAVVPLTAGTIVALEGVLRNYGGWEEDLSSAVNVEANRPRLFE